MGYSEKDFSTAVIAAMNDAACVVSRTGVSDDEDPVVAALIMDQFLGDAKLKRELQMLLDKIPILLDGPEVFKITESKYRSSCEDDILPYIDKVRIILALISAKLKTVNDALYFTINRDGIKKAGHLKLMTQIQLLIDIL